MRIVVTGGCGFIGRALVGRLTTAGHSVSVIDNLLTGDPRCLDGTGATLTPGDIRDRRVLAEVVAGADAVVHLAAETGVAGSLRDPWTDYDVNVGGTLGVLVACRDAGVGRVVFASSGAPLGDAPIPLHEGLAAHPRSPYGASKLAGEGYCLAFQASYGLPTVVLRLANVYGPGSSHKSSVVARFAREALASRRLQVAGDGSQTRDLVHVSDVCQAFTNAITSDVAGEIIHIGTGVETPILRVADLVRGEFREMSIAVEFVPSPAGEITRSCVSTDLARAGLGWAPSIPLERGIAETCRWFAENR